MKFEQRTPRGDGHGVSEPEVSAEWAGPGWRSYFL